MRSLAPTPRFPHGFTKTAGSAFALRPSSAAHLPRVGAVVSTLLIILVLGGTAAAAASDSIDGVQDDALLARAPIANPHSPALRAASNPTASWIHNTRDATRPTISAAAFEQSPVELERLVAEFQQHHGRLVWVDGPDQPRPTVILVHGIYTLEEIDLSQAKERQEDIGFIESLIPAVRSTAVDFHAFVRALHADFNVALYSYDYNEPVASIADSLNEAILTTLSPAQRTAGLAVVPANYGYTVTLEAVLRSQNNPRTRTLWKGAAIRAVGPLLGGSGEFYWKLLPVSLWVTDRKLDQVAEAVGHKNIFLGAYPFREIQTRLSSPETDRRIAEILSADGSTAQRSFLLIDNDPDAPRWYYPSPQLHRQHRTMKGEQTGYATGLFHPRTDFTQREMLQSDHAVRWLRRELERESG